MPKDVEETKQPAPVTVEAAPAKRTSTQAYLDIDQVREGIVILKDGGMRMVLLVSSINFELKSEMERDAIIYAYQSFLNSLEFPIHIVMQSRRLDLDNYLETLRVKGKEETNELLRAQIADYIDFINRLIKIANIMEKRFYIIIPHYPAGISKAGILSQLLTPKAGTVRISNFAEEKKNLVQKAETVVSGLRAVGLRAVQLNTQELIELFYGVYNPEEASIQKLVDISQLESEIIEKLPEEMEIG